MLEEAGLIKRTMGKIASKFGAKETGANLQAKGEMEQKVKQLQISLSQFAGQMGKSTKTMSVGDVSKFFQSKTLPILPALKKLNQETPFNKMSGGDKANIFKYAIQKGARQDVQRQAVAQGGGTPQQQAQQKKSQEQGQTAQGSQGKLGNIAKVLATLDPSTQNSLIAALQS